VEREAARRPHPARYRIAPIELERDAGVCAAFRREMYAASFGTYEGVEAEMGEGDRLYLAQLRAKIAQLPEGNVHLWSGARIVGQAEMRMLEDEPDVGYVSLLYVAPSHRGAGLGRVLHEYALDVFRRRGKRTMRLSVALSNTGALEFYRRLGWKPVGERPNKEPMAIMEFPLG
jgi:ribosomal protein S18 acetylase RimI-like enzyme